MGNLLHGHPGKSWLPGDISTSCDNKKTSITKSQGFFSSFCSCHYPLFPYTDQCANFYRQLVEKGEILDPNYRVDENGKAHFIFGKKRPRASAKRTKTPKEPPILIQDEPASSSSRSCSEEPLSTQDSCSVNRSMEDTPCEENREGHCEKTKRRRGRPRKYPIAEQDSELENSTQTALLKSKETPPSLRSMSPMSSSSSSVFELHHRRGKKRLIFDLIPKPIKGKGKGKRKKNEKKKKKKKKKKIKKKKK